MKHAVLRGNIIRIVVLVLIGLAPGAFAQTRPGRISASAKAQIDALNADKARWTPAERKLDTSLLFAIKRTRKDRVIDQVPELRTGRQLLERGLIEVEITGAIGPSLVTAVEMAGHVINAHKRTIRAKLPLSRIMALAERSDVVKIRRAFPPEIRKVNTSEGDVAHKADVVRTALSATGAGITVGILSDGVDTLAARQATGDLPATVNVVSGQQGEGDEGTAMLEIVYDLAPGATLWFATALGGEEQFAANIAALQAAGCDIIVDDVFYFEESTFQDDVIAQAVNDFTDAGGLYFSSAGNSGNKNDGTSGVWEGDFVDASVDPSAPQLSGQSTHDFGSGSMNLITVDTPSFFILQWSDPIGGSSNDYDLFLLDPTGSNVLDSSEDVQTGTQDPFEYIDSEFFDDTGLRLAILRHSGSDPRFLWLNSNRGRLAQSTNGQISGHATAEDAFGVAAVDASSGTAFDGTESVETFSSDGPRRMFFQADGTPYTPGNFLATGGVVRNQPKIAAADGVSTAAPGFNPFYGTSAAAPHAGAIAALILENSSLSPAGVEQLFDATALDIEFVGFDQDSGHGIVSAHHVVHTTFPSGLGGNEPDCIVDNLVLTGELNLGALTLRACETITISNGVFHDLTLIAFDTVTSTSGTITITGGFTTTGPMAFITSP